MARVKKLPMKWSVHVIGTAQGWPMLHNPKHLMHSKEKVQFLESIWNTFSLTWTLKVAKQSGQHLKLILESPIYKEFPVGTLSMDGKFLQIVGEYFAWTMHIDGNTMSGAGVARNNHCNHYAAHCITMKAIK
ncbi:MAG: hypothetical protein NTY13_01105 [Chlamydiae bacterium]|nr:hypothetical protein [Chlamydiota bacterium]